MNVRPVHAIKKQAVLILLVVSYVNATLASMGMEILALVWLLFISRVTTVCQYMARELTQKPLKIEVITLLSEFMQVMSTFVS